MASYTYSKIARIRHEWRVPGAAFGGFGAAIAEFHKAVAAAHSVYKTIFGSDPTHDDWLRVYAADDDVVLWFEEEKWSEEERRSRDV